MAGRGAHNLILLSRSGAKGAAAKDLVHDLERQGIVVATPEIDIGDSIKLSLLIAELAKSTPPIKAASKQ